MGETSETSWSRIQTRFYWENRHKSKRTLASEASTLTQIYIVHNYRDDTDLYMFSMALNMKCSDFLNLLNTDFLNSTPRKFRNTSHSSEHKHRMIDRKKREKYFIQQIITFVKPDNS